MAPKETITEDSNAVRFGRVKNNLKMGIVGLPNVGKSSLFNLLTESNISAENYPFTTIEPNEARCKVPDARYKWLCDVWQPASEYPAYLHCTDIAGLIKGASEGAGLGNAFLSHIQAVDGIFHCVRAFDNDEIVHVDDSIDALRDLETIQAELCKKDIQYVLTQKDKRIKDVKKDPTMKLPALFFSVMDKIIALLEENKPIIAGDWTSPEVEKINELIPNAITTKPVVYLANLSKKAFVNKGSKWLEPMMKWIKAHGGGVLIPMSVEWEQEFWALRGDAAEEKTARDAFLKSSNGAKSVLPRIVKVGYNQLNLMYYFTAGEKEVRCWTLIKGSTAPQAAGVIHSDFERGFIKAEVVSYDDFKEHSGGDKKGMANVKAAGKMRQEGKSYIVKDGDIIHFQFNVSKPKK